MAPKITNTSPENGPKSEAWGWGGVLFPLLLFIQKSPSLLLISLPKCWLVHLTPLYGNIPLSQMKKLRPKEVNRCSHSHSGSQQQRRGHRPPR